MDYRLFIAINLPLEIKTKIGDLLFSLENDNRDLPIKWVEADNFHLTLHFLGSQNEEFLDKIKSTIINVVKPFSQFTLQLGKISAFPSKNNPRVIYLELKEVIGDNLQLLQKKLGEGLSAMGLTVETKPWQPHVTLGRVKAPCQPNLARTISSENFTVTKMNLMSSDLTSTGPIYDSLGEYQLQ